LTERPKLLDSNIVDEAIRKILPMLKSWLAPGEAFTTPEQEIIDDLKAVLNPTNIEDGFEITLGLRDKGWEVDRHLMHIIDQLDVRSVHEKHVRVWAETSGVTGKYKIGDRVKISDHSVATAGVIEDIYPDRAMYVVHGDDQSDRSSWVIEYEKVSDAGSIATLPDTTEQVPAPDDRSSEAGS
jgi:hypothetical protein